MTDTTLSALFPGLPLMVAGERVFLRPITVAELPTVERVWEGWRLLIASGGEFLETGAWADLIGLLASASAHPVEWVQALDEPSFERLLSYVFAVNGELFDPPNGSGDDTMTWAQIAQRLIQGGHQWETVKTYTLAQVRAFVEALVVQEREAYANDLLAASFAMVDPKETHKIAERIRRGK